MALPSRNDRGNICRLAQAFDASRLTLEGRECPSTRLFSGFFRACSEAIRVSHHHAMVAGLLRPRFDACRALGILMPLKFFLILAAERRYTQGRFIARSRPRLGRRMSPRRGR